MALVAQGRPLIPAFEGELPLGLLLLLRDLHRCWNLDTLYLRVAHEGAVESLIQPAQPWGCEVGQYGGQQALRLLGTAYPETIVWCWWD